MAKFEFFVYWIDEPYGDHCSEVVKASSQEEAEEIVPPTASWWNSYATESLLFNRQVEQGGGVKDGEIHLNPDTFSPVNSTRVKPGDTLVFPTSDVVNGRLEAVYNGEKVTLVGVRATKPTDEFRLILQPPTYTEIENIVVAGRYIDIFYEGGGFVRLPR